MFILTMPVLLLSIVEINNFMKKIIGLHLSNNRNLQIGYSLLVMSKLF